MVLTSIEFHSVIGAHSRKEKRKHGEINAMLQQDLRKRELSKNIEKMLNPGLGSQNLTEECLSLRLQEGAGIKLTGTAGAARSEEDSCKTELVP